ncbi:MAG TPA: hypothetical protein VHK70_07760 [Burkholderiaceae bacterium]|nr:hypothetical protein [Burkholderiaceae bacterium]
MIPSPIIYRDTPCYSFKQIDEHHRTVKGTTFLVFKRGLSMLTEGGNFFYLPAAEEHEFIEPLRESGLIYRSTRNLVLLTDAAYQILFPAETSDMYENDSAPQDALPE